MRLLFRLLSHFLAKNNSSEPSSRSYNSGGGHGTAVGRIQSSCDCVLRSWASLAYDLPLLWLRLRLANRRARATSNVVLVPVLLPKQRDELSLVSALAEDMGLEEVRIVQTLKFQGGKAPSTFVPRIVPILNAKWEHICRILCQVAISGVSLGMNDI